VVTGAMIQEAEAITEWHRSQIQGFHYKALSSDRHQHVVRDVSRKADDWLWSKEGGPSDYDATHAAMMTEIDRVRANILADEINAIVKGNA
jgi:hypothetical protein